MTTFSIVSVRFDPLHEESFENIKASHKQFNDTIVPHNNDKLVFAQGNGRMADNISEIHICAELGTKIKCNAGGGKRNSSSWIFKEWEVK
ncbi:MAG: hypothetical protein LBC11_03205 [Puniceicoccales bacterium]|nr:hypothetical protein [Puniceicoccales bacterium]